MLHVIGWRKSETRKQNGWGGVLLLEESPQCPLLLSWTPPLHSLVIIILLHTSGEQLIFVCSPCIQLLTMYYPQSVCLSLRAASPGHSRGTPTSRDAVCVHRAEVFHTQKQPSCFCFAQATFKRQPFLHPVSHFVFNCTLLYRSDLNF